MIAIAVADLSTRYPLSLAAGVVMLDGWCPWPEICFVFTIQARPVRVRSLLTALVPQVCCIGWFCLPAQEKKGLLSLALAPTTMTTTTTTLISMSVMQPTPSQTLLLR